MGNPDPRLKLLETVADYEQSPAEAQAELEEEGVDVPKFLQRVYEAVDNVRFSDCGTKGRARVDVEGD